MTMKRRADLVMVVLTVLFLISLVLMSVVGEPVWLLLLQAILEGALVGSVADWFAVKALFDAPLGIRFHTRLIPRKRAALVRAIADGVQEQVLSRRVIRLQVSETMLIEQILASIETYGVERILANVWTKYADEATWARRGADSLTTKAKDGRLADILREENVLALSGTILAVGSDMAGSEQFALRVKSYLDAIVEEKTRGMLAKMFLFFGEASGAVDTKEAAQLFAREFSTYLARASVREDDVLRAWIARQVREVIGRLDEAQTVMNVSENENVRELVVDLTARIAKAVRANGKETFVQEGAKCYHALAMNERFLMELEAKLRWAVYRLATARGYLIGEAIERTLASYGEDEMRDFVEAKVGDDLQWIRLNGAVLGGLLGLIMFGLLYLGRAVLS